MTKKFNIHDWQAKQLLSEQDNYDKRQDALTPGKNPDAFYGDGSLDKLRNLGDDKAVIDGRIIGEIIELISRNDIDPMDVMEEIGVEFDINFDFSGGAPGMTKYGGEMPGPGRAFENTTGGGASFQAGAGEGYMTPNAFKKKKKK